MLPKAGVNKPGGIFLRDWHGIPEEHRNLLLATANVALSGTRGSLQQQLVAAGENPPPPPFVPSGSSRGNAFDAAAVSGIAVLQRPGRLYSGWQGVRDLSQTRYSNPFALVNVMASINFGAIVTESGLGCTWNGNSQTNRLTPWQNDPVS